MIKKEKIDVSQDLVSTLEFDKVLNLLAENLICQDTKESIESWVYPMKDVEDINLEIKYELDLDGLLQSYGQLPISPFRFLKDEVDKLAIENYILNIDQILNIRSIIVSIHGVIRYFNKDRKREYPHFYSLVNQIVENKVLEKAVTQYLDEKGNIFENATPELKKIHQTISKTQKELDSTFNSVLLEYKKSGILADTEESIRNGRRVFCVAANYKYKVKGILHDESKNGHVAYIEPDRVILVNNRLFDLENEKKREEYRIISMICNDLREYRNEISNYESRLIQIDILQAKAKFAQSYAGIAPEVLSEPCINLEESFHPLLLLKNKKENKPIVPMTLKLFPPNRILVLSGPNAGGKSVGLKTLGLLQIMFQSGMLIPAKLGSKMGVFEQIFADIGDKQSLEDDLSTYSSHLKAMKEFSDQGGDKSLILIDEFGSGTDPKIGGALASAVLGHLNRNGCWGMVTTHYGNLKIMAFKVKGLINGAMLFDEETLSPKYVLKVGNPGSSYGFEIAHKSGLNNNILTEARKRSGKNTKAIDDLLISLQREKAELEETVFKLQKKQGKLDDLIKNYENLQFSLDVRRKKFKLLQKEKAVQESSKYSRELNKLVQQLQKEKNVNKAKESLKKLQKEQAELQKEAADLTEDIYYKDSQDTELTVGDFVKMRKQGYSGQIIHLQKNKAEIMVGQIKMSVNRKDIIRIDNPISINSNRSINLDTIQKRNDFISKLDIRGMRAEDALKVIENFLDQALLANVSSVEILHGKGNGVLREMVKEKSKEYSTATVSHPANDSGGIGVSIVKL